MEFPHLKILIRSTQRGDSLQVFGTKVTIVANMRLNFLKQVIVAPALHFFGGKTFRVLVLKGEDEELNIEKTDVYQLEHRCQADYR